MLLAGALGLAFLSACLPLLDRESGFFVLKRLDTKQTVATLPDWFMGGLVVAAMLGGLGVLWSLLKDARLHAALGWCWRWVASHFLLSLLLVAVIVCGAMDVYELLYDPFSRKHGLRPWMLREDVQGWMMLAAVVLGGLALSAVSGQAQWTGRLADRFDNNVRGRGVYWWVLAALVPLALGTAMAGVALEGIPHFSDSLTYLMQGRILHSGRLWVEAPEHIELFQHSLFFIETDGRFYGKYPIGWPTILGTFDAGGVGFAANAVLAGLAAVLTGLLAREFASPRVAVLAALLFGVSPWVWFNGANFASHVSAACAVTGFMWLYLSARRTDSFACALGAGLVLGAAVLIRPFDAAMFALPVALLVLVDMVRRPKKWLILGPVIAVGALVGVGIYLWVNANTTGGAFKSPYAEESRWDKDWNPSPLSMLARLAFQWAELNSRVPGWGIGGLTVAVLGAIAAGPVWRTAGLRLLAASTVLFFVGCTAFGFTNVWWGPRWLAPVTPLLAVLAAQLVDRVIAQLMAPMAGQIKDAGASCAAQLAVCVMAAGLVIGAGCRYAGQFYQHAVSPPHLVSSQAHRAVVEAGIDHAVVGLPPAGEFAPLDARAGMVYMGVPFESNTVVYVRAVPNWVRYANECFPGRAVYKIQPDPNGTNGLIIRAVQ